MKVFVAALFVAAALFRFHRVEDARAAIDTAEKRAHRDRALLAAEHRTRLDAALAAFRSCVSSAAAPAMALLIDRYGRRGGEPLGGLDPACSRGCGRCSPATSLIRRSETTKCQFWR